MKNPHNPGRRTALAASLALTTGAALVTAHSAAQSPRLPLRKAGRPDTCRL